MPQCQATTKRGTPCHANARAGQPWCHMHRFDGRSSPDSGEQTNATNAAPPSLTALPPQSTARSPRPEPVDPDLRLILFIACAVAAGVLLAILMVRILGIARSE